MTKPSKTVIDKFLPVNSEEINHKLYSYDMMSNSVIWKDEVDMQKIPVDMLNFMREVFAYRSGLLRGEQLDEYQDSWNYLKKWHPLWSGFHSCRSLPTPEMTSFLKSSSDLALQELDECFD